MNHRQVAEAFAEGKTEARGFNMFVHGDTIYSYGYHFPIARHTGKYLKDGKEIVLFNSNGYSNTTSKHKSFTGFALRNEFLVMIPQCEDIKNGELYLKSLIDEALTKKARARVQWSIDRWDEQERNAREQLQVLSKYFN